MRAYKREFKKFLKKYSRTFNTYDFKCWCEDLENQHFETGINYYILYNFESLDNQQHIFYY